MRKNSTVYYVGGEKALYSSEDWDKLQYALHFAGDGFLHRIEYHTMKAITNPQKFAISRTDHKLITAPERTALYWYFYGVMTALKIKPMTGKDDNRTY